MRRRSSVSGSCWPFRSPSPRRQLILFSVGVALLFSLAAALQVRAQDANPPPPPPDASAPQAPPAPGQSDIRAVRISDVKGQVQVFQNGQLAFPQAEPNMPAVEGMRFVTGENGRLEIQFEDGSVARLAPNSSLRLAELRRNADGTTVTRIDALTGLSYYELLATPNQVSVTFDGAEISPSDNTTFRIALDPVPNQLAVMQGVVNIDDGGGVSLDVHPGHTFQIDPAQQGSFSVADSIQPNTWDQWNAHRDQVLAELANSGSPGTVDSGDAAWNDLNAYGNWYNVPGYGASWAPYGSAPHGIPSAPATGATIHPSAIPGSPAIPGAGIPTTAACGITSAAGVGCGCPPDAAGMATGPLAGIPSSPLFIPRTDTTRHSVRATVRGCVTGPSRSSP